MGSLSISDVKKMLYVRFLDLPLRVSQRINVIQECSLIPKLVRVLIFNLCLGCVNRSFNKMWTFFQSMIEELGVALILLGFFMTFFGSKYPQATLFFAGSGAASLICLVSTTVSEHFRSSCMV